MDSPKQVAVYMFDPYRRVLLLSVKLDNVPGALMEVLRILKGHKINVLGSSSSVEPGASSGVWSAFVEGAKLEPEKLRKQIESAEGVVTAAVVGNTDGFLVDSALFPLAWNTGDRAVMMRYRFLNAMFNRVREAFGSGGEVIIFEEGFAYGNESWKDLVESVGRDFARSHIKEMLMIYQAVGWFRLEGVELGKEGTVTMRAAQNFECEGAKSTSPRSHFVRGHLAGSLTAIMGERMSCEETKCVAKGDPFCEFTLTPEKHP